MQEAVKIFFMCLKCLVLSAYYTPYSQTLPQQQVSGHLWTKVICGTFGILAGYYTTLGVQGEEDCLGQTGPGLGGWRAAALERSPSPFGLGPISNTRQHRTWEESPACARVTGTHISVQLWALKLTVTSSSPSWLWSGSHWRLKKYNNFKYIYASTLECLNI